MSTWFEVWITKETCRELSIALMGRVTGSHVISAQTIRSSRQNARGYCSILFEKITVPPQCHCLLNNEEYYCSPAGKARTPLIVKHVKSFYDLTMLILNMTMSIKFNGRRIE